MFIISSAQKFPRRIAFGCTSYKTSDCRFSGCGSLKCLSGATPSSLIIQRAKVKMENNCHDGVCS